MTIAGKGLRAPQTLSPRQARSAIVALIAIMATGGCAKQDGAPPTASADAAATQSSETAPIKKGPAAPPSIIPEPFHGMWAATADACQMIQEEGLEPAVAITADEVRDVEYETYCKLHKVVSASATELVAEFVCPSADDPTPAPAPRTLALAAGRLVFQDRSVSYLRCTSKVPAPPVELAEPIEAPPPDAKDIELKVPDYMTQQNFVNFTWNSLFCSGILTEEIRRETVPPEAREGFRTVAQMYRNASEEFAKRAGLSESEFADQRDREIPAEVRKVYELAATSGEVRRGLTEQLETCVKQSKTMSMLAMAIIYEDAKARESDPSKPAPAAPFGKRSATSSPVTANEPGPGTTAGGASVYRRCLTDPAGPKAFTEARLNRMGSLARDIDQYANGQYETYSRMRESYGYMERSPNGTPDSICSFADLIPVESFEKTLQQLQSNYGAR